MTEINSILNRVQESQLKLSKGNMQCLQFKALENCIIVGTFFQPIVDDTA